MGKMIQIRNVPPQLHAELRRRAKETGKTLTDYIEQILVREVSRPPREEVFARIQSRQPVALKRPASDYVAEARREAS